MVDVDTSGPEVDVTIEEPKEEAVVETKEETGTTEQESVEEVKEEPEKEEPEEETKQEDDTKLEDYSKGVQSRIAKLTRKMREAERREGAAVEYAQALENKRKVDQERFQKLILIILKDLRTVLNLEWTQRKKILREPSKLKMLELKSKQTNV